MDLTHSKVILFSLAWQNGAINTSRAVQAIAENVLPGNLRIHRGPKKLQQLRVHRVGWVHPWALFLLLYSPRLAAALNLGLRLFLLDPLCIGANRQTGTRG